MSYFSRIILDFFLSSLATIDRRIWVIGHHLGLPSDHGRSSVGRGPPLPWEQGDQKIPCSIKEEEEMKRTTQVPSPVKEGKKKKKKRKEKEEKKNSLFPLFSLFPIFLSNFRSLLYLFKFFSL